MDEHVKVDYANGASVSFGPAEVRFLFTLNTPIVENGKDTGELKWDEVADIRISPMLAKRIRDLLSENLPKIGLSDNANDNAKESTK